jgi:hypothetical protein
MPWLSAMYLERNYMFHQNGKSAHTDNTTPRFLESNMALQWFKEIWLLYSPDLNPLNYGIWGFLDQYQCHCP